MILSIIYLLFLAIASYFVFLKINSKNVDEQNYIYNISNNHNNYNNLHITTSYLENVVELQNISAVSSYGIGLLTYIVTGFIHIFGVSNALLCEKIKKAEEKAINGLKEKACLKQADGIMNFHVQISGLTVYVYGTPFRFETDDNTEDEHA